MIETINIFDILAKTGSCTGAEKVIINIIKGNPKAEFDVRVHGVTINKDIIKLLAEILFYCDEQGSQVSISGISDEEASLIMGEKIEM